MPAPVYCDITNPSLPNAGVQSLGRVTARQLFDVCLETDYCTCIPTDRNILIDSTKNVKNKFTFDKTYNDTDSDIEKSVEASSSTFILKLKN